MVASLQLDIEGYIVYDCREILNSTLRREKVDKKYLFYLVSVLNHVFPQEWLSVKFL